MRLLVAADVPPDPNAGASGTVYQMNAALRRLGCTVDEVWAPELGRRLKHGNLHYLLELPRTYRAALRRHAAQHDYDILEFNQPHAYLAAEDHRRSGRPGLFVNRSHGHEVRSEEALDQWRTKLGVPGKQGLAAMISRVIRRGLDNHWVRIARAADGFVVSSREDRDFLVDRYRVPAERIGVITQGATEAFIAREPTPMNADRLRRVLYVGQLAFFKAPMMLGKAVSELLRRRPEAEFTWVCSHEHHAAARALLDADVLPRAKFRDWMPQPELVDVLDGHGVFLFPSFFEGFGKAPLEAMTRGMCVVGCAVGGLRDFIEDGVSGRLVAPGDPQGMAAAAAELLANLEASCRMSAAARAVAVTHTWERCAREAMAFYSQLQAMGRRT